MKRIWKIIFFLLSSVAIISLIVYLLVRLTPEPPLVDISYARNALAESGKVRADIYSRKLYQEAKNAYDSAMANWVRENKRFIYFRNFEKVKEYAETSARKAIQASSHSRESSANLETNLRKKIARLNELVREIDDIFTAYPLSPEVRNRISKGKMLLKESEIDYSSGSLVQADRKITDSEYLLTTSYDNAHTNLKNYFSLFPVWKKWVDLTIARSKESKDYSIIVDKYSRKVIVFLAGKKKYEYTAELGKNWVGDKRLSGDKATPEGMYRITKKFDSSKTKYYKALLIDYPNAEDTSRFREEKANGTIPANARIGGLIEIHGNGGRGVDWTDGCIALTDKEMDVIYKIAKVGTPVTIVGSTTDLPELLNNR